MCLECVSQVMCRDTRFSGVEKQLEIIASSRNWRRHCLCLYRNDSLRWRDTPPTRGSVNGRKWINKLAIDARNRGNVFGRRRFEFLCVARRNWGYNEGRRARACTKRTICGNKTRPQGSTIKIQSKLVILCDYLRMYHLWSGTSCLYTGK